MSYHAYTAHYLSAAGAPPAVTNPKGPFGMPFHGPFAGPILMLFFAVFI